MVIWVLRFFAHLPLGVIHGTGVFLGWTVYIVSPTYRKRLKANFLQSRCFSGFESFNFLLKRSIAEAGKGLAELAAVWFREDAAKLVVLTQGYEIVEQAKLAGKAIIFLTPHLGCFEISALYIADKMPLTVLYRQPKLKWLESLMALGRSSLGLAPANLQGVRKLFRALKKGEAIGLLPDQAPSAGEGVWADFFGRPAYTMTLVSRLKEVTDAQIILVFAKRLPKGGGYHLFFSSPSQDSAEPSVLNKEIESLIKKCPEQYLWSYNRYKIPSGARPPVEEET